VAKKRRGARFVSEQPEEETVTEETEETDSEETAEPDEDEAGDAEDSDEGDEEQEELEVEEVSIKLASPKQFVNKLSANITEKTQVLFHIGGTLVAACDNGESGSDSLVRILPTQHAADLAQFLYDELEGEGQDPNTVKDIAKNGYDFVISTTW